MKLDWQHVVERFNVYPPRVHRLLPPCSEARISAVQGILGVMPAVLVDMVRHFNGAEVFLYPGPMLTIFGISTDPPLPQLEWAPDWYIDKFTPSWRSFSKRNGDWAIAKWNYGGLVVLDRFGWTEEWDTSQGRWGSSKRPFDEWIEAIFREGDAFLKEE